MLDEQIEDVIFSVLYKNASSTRRINKLKKVNNSLGS
jgi:hypothetical protein